MPLQTQSILLVPKAVSRGTQVLRLLLESLRWHTASDCRCADCTGSMHQPHQQIVGILGSVPSYDDGMESRIKYGALQPFSFPRASTSSRCGGIDISTKYSVPDMELQTHIHSSLFLPAHWFGFTVQR